MKPTFLSRFLMTALLVGVGIAGAASKDAPNVPQTDTAIAQHIRHEILMYPRYSIFDDVNFQVNNGQVDLLGAVSQPFKKSDIQRIVERVPGVTSVTDELKVLPLSPMDNRLRLQVARAIYGYPTLQRYGQQALPPIHIIVENGHVTLTGIVATQGDKDLAGIRANSAGLSFGMVTNNLQVEHPSPKKS